MQASNDNNNDDDPDHIDNIDMQVRQLVWWWPSVRDPIIDRDVEEKFLSRPEVVTGEVQFGSQYHFHIETQTFLVTLEKDGVRVISTTQ